MSKPLKLLDLFSGIGGFSLGLERSGGFKTVAFCEIDPFCRRVLAKHWPKIPCHDDISTRQFERGEADAICGGFPCQNVSDAGRRAGITGARSRLWGHLARAIRLVRPKLAIVENVAALLGRGMGTVCGDLAEIGYDAEWHCIPASAVGADHVRDRIWLIANPHSEGAEPVDLGGRQPCTSEMGEDASNNNGTRLAWRLQTGANRENARTIGAWLGPALRAPLAFPGLDGAGAPVLGRGENGIPNRVDRMHALGNAVVPQIPEMIGRAILEAEGL